MTVADHTFEENRRLLEGIAYRMCGVLADAQDVVQETYLRWRNARPDEVREPRAWLVTVCTRISLDLIKSAHIQREAYIGPWLPEPFLDEQARDPADLACIDETVSIALMLALEKLSPPERATFLLHDVFGYSFDDVSAILEKPEPACRKLASRARTAIRSTSKRYTATAEVHQNLLDAFLRAAQSGEVANLKSLLIREVELHADGGGRVKTASGVLRGAESVAQFLISVWRDNVAKREDVLVVKRRFNGQPGVVIYQKGHPVAALSMAITTGQIAHVFALRNPGKLFIFEGKTA